MRNSDEYQRLVQERIAEGVQNNVRWERNKLLAETVDKINPLQWEAMTVEEKQAWRDYRQALLDIPQQADFPHNIVMPIAPNKKDVNNEPQA